MEEGLDQSEVYREGTRTNPRLFILIDEEMDLSIPYHLENFIGGNLIGPLSGNFINNINPATGAIYGQVPDSNEKDVNAAVDAATKAFAGWSATTAEERFKILNRIAELIEENLDVL